MKIGELSRRSGFGRDTIRHYVDLELLVPQRDPANRYQLFDQRALSRLHFIRSAKQLGLRLVDIRAIFADAARAGSPCPRVRELMESRITETRRCIAELQSLCDRMEAAIDCWRDMPDRTPTGESVCHLIESQFSRGAQFKSDVDGGQVDDNDR